MRRAWVWSIALVAAVVGCGPPSLSLSDWSVAHRDAACAREVRCGFYDTVETCQRQVLPRSILGLAGAIDRGVTRFDGEAAAACVDALATQACGDDHDPCADVLRGVIADGDTCFLDDECASASCSASCDPATCCSGTCAPTITIAVIGGSCADASCAVDAYCTADQRCASRLPIGAVCDPQGYACATDAYCDQATAHCRALPVSGGPCASVGSDLTCLSAGLTCNTLTSRCQPLYVFEGAGCSQGFEFCAPYLRCDLSTLRCRLHESGDPCSSDFYCGVDQFCENQGCSGKRSLGTVCTSARQCESGACGEAGVCVERAICF